ncbi:MAG: outer membrane protein assembly factor BamD [Hyphomicrobium sp.]
MTSNLQRLCSLSLAVLSAMAFNAPARAEPALDRVLASVQVANQKQCSAINIAFNLRVRYLSHFPQQSGQELRIQIRPLDGAKAAAEIMTNRESLRSPQTKFGRIRAIDFEARNAAGPVLIVQFDQPAHFEVSQGADFQSIVVKILASPGTKGCRADFPRQGSIGSWSTEVVSANGSTSGVANAKPSTHGAGTASPEQSQKAAALMDEGRAALRKSDFTRAIAKFKAILALPQSPSSAEAQEMLALAYQRNKDTDRARAEYEDYLIRYPAGEDSDRVRQRLAAIVTASGEGGEKLKAARDPSAKPDDGTRTWTMSGSAAQFYIRDDSFRTVRDPSLPPIVNQDLDSIQTHQNELLTSLDAIATWSGGGSKSKLRFSGTEQHKFDKDDDIVGVSALFFETAIRDWGTEFRVGRQTRNTGGVLGRFDGAALSFAAAEPYRVNIVAGSPVERRRDTPFEDEKLFYGASVDIGPFDGLDATLFAIEQRDRSIIDRRAVGAELRYFDADKSAFAMADYDIHYNDLNAALLTGSWTLADKSNFHGAFDYRKSPYLSTWTALQGQGYPSLYEMLRNKTLAEIEQLAVDRTTSLTSVSGGFARPLNDTFQVSLDVTMTNYGGTPASDIVPATTGTGNEYFYQAQIIGNGVLTEGDLAVAGFRYADLQHSDLYVLDLSARYPLMDSLKINPRLLLEYRTGKTTDLEAYSLQPSILVDYYVTRDWMFEVEVGARWTDQIENAVEDTTTDLFFTIGYRYDFYADGMLTSAARAAPYGAGGPKP